MSVCGGCIGVALGLVDQWLSGADAHAPKDLGHRVQRPSGHWLGERAATDILALAHKGRAYRSLDTLLGLVVKAVSSSGVQVEAVGSPR